jgi:hypothetical protein
VSLAGLGTLTTVTARAAAAFAVGAPIGALFAARRCARRLLAFGSADLFGDSALAGSLALAPVAALAAWSLAALAPFTTAFAFDAVARALFCGLHRGQIGRCQFLLADFIGTGRCLLIAIGPLGAIATFTTLATLTTFTPTATAFTALARLTRFPGLTRFTRFPDLAGFAAIGSGFTEFFCRALSPALSAPFALRPTRASTAAAAFAPFLALALAIALAIPCLRVIAGPRRAGFAAALGALATATAAAAATFTAFASFGALAGAGFALVFGFFSHRPVPGWRGRRQTGL